MNFTFPAPSRAFQVAVAFGLAVLVAGIVLAIYAGDIHSQTAGFIIVLVGAGIAGGAAVFPLSMPDEAAQSDLEREARAVYGVQLTTAQLYELQPPRKRPAAPEVYGTVAVMRAGRPLTVSLVYNGQQFILTDADGDELTRVDAAA